MARGSRRLEQSWKVFEQSGTHGTLKQEIVQPDVDRRVRMTLQGEKYCNADPTGKPCVRRSDGRTFADGKTDL